MSLYCIGDLHGRYDLFTMALEKICFDYEKDKLYILGDIIDVNYGALKIFKHIIEYPDSFEFILGNHESQFINMINAYDTIMLDNNLRLIVKKLMESYSDKLFSEIKDVILNQIKHKNIQLIRKNKSVMKWLKVSSKRKLMLEVMLDLLEYINFNENIFKNIAWVLSNTDGMFKTKQFVKELVETSIEEYIILKKYIYSKKSECKFTYLSRKFWLRHSNYFNSFNYPKIKKPNELQPIKEEWRFVERYECCSIFRHIPDITSTNIYLIYGHDPVSAMIHKALRAPDYLFGYYKRTIFDFNYKEIFSYIDSFDNHYFNLDLGSNPVGILRLDDFEEFYVGIEPKRKTDKYLEIPCNTSSVKRTGYNKLDHAEFFGIENGKFKEYKINKKGFSFVSYKDCCFQFLIGVNTIKKQIYYTRIDFLDTYYCQVLRDWYKKQTIEEIIEKVSFDFDAKKNGTDQLAFEKRIRNIG